MKCYFFKEIFFFSGPPEFIKDREFVSLPLGNTTEFFCAVTSNPDPSYEWTFNNNDSLPSNITFQMVPHGQVLEINNITQNHFGNYTCTASNIINNRTMSSSYSFLLEESMFCYLLTFSMHRHGLIGV